MDRVEAVKALKCEKGIKLFCRHLIRSRLAYLAWRSHPGLVPGKDQQYITLIPP